MYFFGPYGPAFVLALVGGTLLAVGHYVAGVVLALIALVIYALALRARERGEDHDVDRRIY